MLSLPVAVKPGTKPPTSADMRLGFDGLFALVRSRLNADPLSGHLFIFRNRSADRLKVLYWGGHGLVLMASTRGSRSLSLPDAAPSATGVSELTVGQFQMILDGIDLNGVKRFKRF